VRFAAERNEHGHSDRFWSLCLALHASRAATQPFSLEGVRIGRPMLPNMPRFTPRLLQGWRP
jgi:phage FluMu gp28-like protein